MNESPDERLVREEEEEAAREAAGIGGAMPEDERDLDPAERPLVEAGEGEAEGFEQAERALEENASHGNQHAFPEGVFRPETESGAEYGEADEVIPEDG